MSDFEKQIVELNASLKQVGDQIKAQAEQVNTQISNFGEMNKETRAKVDDLLTVQGELQARLSAAEQAMLANEKREGGEDAPKTVGQMVAESLKEQGVTSSLRGSHRVSMPRSAITSIDSSGG
nr:phage major capsid protein [Pseudomonas aeruginosa]MCZ8010310.1 phage major capsid protein [Pseudomonas aeruginosa]MCZ9799336.1 phage major capsid protein [Pseudomonas aeruginosa]